MTPEAIDRYLTIIIIYQLLLFSGMLYFLGVNQTRSKKILAFFFFTIWIYYAALGSYYLGYIGFTTHLYFLFAPAVLTSLPLFWLYIKSLVTEGFTFCTKELLHFLPAALVLLINSMLYGLLTSDQKEWFMVYGFNQPSDDAFIRANQRFYFFWDYLLFFIQIPVYFVLIIRTIKRHREAIKHMFSSLEEKKLTWLVWGVSFFFFLIIINNLLIQTDLVDIVGYRISYNSAMLTFTAFLFFSGMKQVDLYDLQIGESRPANGNIGKLLSKIGMNCKSKTDTTSQDSHKEKYLASGLKEEEKELILETLDRLMKTKKPFLNPELKITDLVAEVEFSRRQVSQTINEKLNLNFYNFVNRYRISEARRIMEDEDFRKYTIEGVAQQVGFKSRSSFYTAFKSETGRTPSEFCNQPEG